MIARKEKSIQKRALLWKCDKVFFFTMTDTYQPGANVFETQGLDDECTENGPPDGKSNGRAYKAGKWSPTETLTLVYCKRGHFLKYGPLNHRRNIGVSAAERWIEMEDEMLRRNVMRSKSQCQEKWEQLASDFKKVYDHQQNHVPLGEPSYFQMTQAERKEHMLRFPKANLDETVYNALCEWYPRNSVGMDPGDLPSDSPFDLAAMSRGGKLTHNCNKVLGKMDSLDCLSITSPKNCIQIFESSKGNPVGIEVRFFTIGGSADSF